MTRKLNTACRLNDDTGKPLRDLRFTFVRMALARIAPPRAANDNLAELRRHLLRVDPLDCILIACGLLAFVSVPGRFFVSLVTGALS